MKKKISVDISFKWFDFWVGAYWDKTTKSLYICLIPMFPVHIKVEGTMICKNYGCGAEMEKVAVDTGDGWALLTECPECGNIEDLEWPFRDEFMSPKQLEDAGYRIE